MADAASLAFQNTWAMDAASNLSETIDRSRPVPRVCRRTGACPACKQQQLRRSRSTASGLLQMVSSSNTSLSGLHTCLVLNSHDLHTHVHAWLGITNLGGGEDTANDRVRARISSGPACTYLHHETNNTARLLCLPSRLRRQPTPAQLQRADCQTGWAVGAHAPAFQA